MKYIIIFYFLLFSNTFCAVEIPEATFKNPRDTMNYFLKAMKSFKLGNKDSLKKATGALNLSEIDPSAKQSAGELAAIKLINTLDRLEYINIENIPNFPKNDIWIYRSRSINLDKENFEVEIAIAKMKKGLWKFTPSTVSTISYFERFIKDKEIAKGVTKLTSWKTKLKERMPKWTGHQSFILLNGQWLGLFGIIFLAFIIDRLVRLYLMSVFLKYLGKTSASFDEKFQKKLTLPLAILSFAIVWSIGINLLEFEEIFLVWFLKAGKVAITLGIIMVAYCLVDMVCLFLEKKALESENKFDDILVPLIRKSAKTFIIAVGIIAIGDSLNLDMKGLLAGMGIIGLGVSLAAKDTLSNLFGSLTVLLDRPFEIGDWVLIDGKIEGTIEEVGLRSCRIRTFYDSQITLPNGRLTNADIDNYGRRKYRRFSTKLGVQYDTPPEKIEAFCEGVRQIILAHEYTRKEYFHVYLNGMGNSSLEIIVYLFWAVPSWNQELQERHRLLIDIIRLAKEMGVEFAFPTQTLHMINSQNTSYNDQPEISENQFYARELADKIIKRPFSTKLERSGRKSGEMPPQRPGE